MNTNGRVGEVDAVNEVIPRGAAVCPRDTLTYASSTNVTVNPVESKSDLEAQQAGLLPVGLWNIPGPTQEASTDSCSLFRSSDQETRLGSGRTCSARCWGRGKGVDQ